MIKFLKNETWKELKFAKNALRNRYAFSSHGRVVSFTTDIEKGNLLKGSLTSGYPSLNLKPGGIDKTSYIHRIIAELHLGKAPKGKEYVIHLDFDKTNNAVKNLRWVSHEEMFAHQAKNPKVQKHRKMLNSADRERGHKLTVAKVRELKKTLASSNRRSNHKQIAEKFGISEMQLYRIKSGVNWAHVKP